MLVQVLRAWDLESEEAGFKSLITLLTIYVDSRSLLNLTKLVSAF